MPFLLICFCEFCELWSRLSEDPRAKCLKSNNTNSIQSRLSEIPMAKGFKR